MRVRYFAWLRARLNRAEERVEMPSGVTNLNGLIDHLITLSPGHAAVFEDRSKIRAAINQKFSNLDSPFLAGDEIAFFPPITGAEPMRITRVQAEPFDPGMELTRFTGDASQAGAIVSFTGRVRPHDHRGQPLTAMTLEHYPGMTETQIAQIAEAATQRWPLERLLVLHRFGRLLPSEPIVFVAAAAARRRPAFEAAEFLMDWLKTRAPFWKLEESLGGEAWVASKEEDAQAAGRWGNLSSPHAIDLEHLSENHRRFSDKCSKVARFDSGEQDRE